MSFGGVGIGLRPQHYQEVLFSGSAIPLPWCEVISENFIFSRGLPRHNLHKVREQMPVAFHGVCMSIGSERDGFDLYLKALKDLIHEIEPCIVSDHLCWTGYGNKNTFDLLPLPYTQEALTQISERVDRVQSFLQRKVFFENASAYISFAKTDMSEADFFRALVDKTGCGILLDVNNVFVNSVNFGFDPYSFIDQIRASDVGQIHLAGHSKVEDFLFDTHDHPVCDAVWNLYRYTIQKLGNIPTLIEWDAEIPSFEILLSECKKAEIILNTKETHEFKSRKSSATVQPENTAL